MRPLHATAERALASLIQQTPLSPGKVEFVWRAAVGPALARVTRVRLGAEGVLLVHADDSRWTREVCRSSALITRRLNALFGETVIKQIRAQDA